jgi:predicted PurR-regulated permease PerM
MDRRYTFVKKLTVYIIFFIVAIYGLIKAQSFLAPIFLAGLFSYLLFPIANFLEKKGVPRILSNLISILAGVVVIAGIVFFFSQQVSVFADDFPEMKKQAESNLRSLEEWISSTFGVSAGNIRSWAEDRLTSLTEENGVFKTAFQTTTSTIVMIGLMPVYIFFMLYYRSKFHDFIIKMAPDQERERTENILDEVNRVATQYMTGVFTVVIILMVINSIGLSIVGLEYPVFLGITAALFNFIPYFGTLIGALIPVLFSLLTGDTLSLTLWVIIFFLIIQFTENNILTPNITGGSVRLNPFITILTLILGSSIWGIIGMFIVVPAMAMFRIFCEHVGFLKPLAYLLSDRGTEKYALTWDKVKKKFKSD